MSRCDNNLKMEKQQVYSSRVMPELLKVGRMNSDFGAMLKDFVGAVWRERHVPQDWQDVINLHCCCDN